MGCSLTLGCSLSVVPAETHAGVSPGNRAAPQCVLSCCVRGPQFIPSYCGMDLRVFDFGALGILLLLALRTCDVLAVLLGSHARRVCSPPPSQALAVSKGKALI